MGDTGDTISFITRYARVRAPERYKRESASPASPLHNTYLRPLRFAVQWFTWFPS